MSLAEQRWLRLFTLCVLYVAQGIPWGFTATTLPAYLIQRGLDFGLVTTTLSFTVLPYSFKWVWGPIIDAFTLPRFGRRRPWILFAQAMMALTIITMIALDVTTEIKLLAWMVFIHTIFNALQDVAVDALAVELLAEDERGRANGLMYGSKYAGGAIGGIGMASLIAWADLDTALVVQTAVLVAIMMVPLLVRERSGPPAPREPIGEIARAFPQAFSLRSTLVAALLMLGMNFATGIVVPNSIQLFVGELGWKYDEYTAISGGWGLAVGCGSAAAAGFLVDRFGRRRVAAVASCALAAGWLTFALLRPWWSDPMLAYGLGLYTAACQAINSVALIALCMDLSWPRIAGSQFTAYMALSNFSTALGYQFAARAFDLWEFHGIFLFAGGAQLVVTLLLIPIDPHETRSKLPLPPGQRVNRLGIAGLIAIVVFLIAMTIYVTHGTLG